MSRKLELLELMNIDTSWMKNHNHNIDNSPSLDDLKTKASDCRKCQLFKERTKVVFGSGSHDASVLFVGEAPGREEDLNGEPFIGRAGKLLTEILFSVKLSRRDVYITNTVKCRPPENRNPDDDEINACSTYLDQQINLISPSVIVLLGKIAAEALMSTSEPMSSLRGKVHLYKDTQIPMLVFYHPAYLLRSPGEKSKVWDDLLLLKKLINVS